MAFLDRSTLLAMGFGSVGENVLISDKASFHNCGNIHLGSHVRIDDFCVLSAGEGGIAIGSRVHIAVFCSLIGKGKISLGDFCNMSSRVSVYSSNDDYTGNSLTNPMVPEDLRKVFHADVFLSKHVIIGSGSVILPGVELGEGVAIGALSLVKSRCEPFGIYAGVPARKIGDRDRRLQEVEAALARRDV